MPWVEGISILQYAKENLEKIIPANGWDWRIKYRLVHRPDEYHRNCAEVSVFRAKGSDNQIRYLGVVKGYGGHLYKPANKDDVISQYSELGQLEGDLDGVNKTFRFKVFPLVPETVTVYIDGNEVDEDNVEYEIDGLEGIVTFKVAPTGSEITALYQPAAAAPTIVKRLGLFTYEAAKHEAYIIPSQIMNTETLLGVSDGSHETTYIIPTNKRIRDVVVQVGSITNFQELIHGIDFEVESVKDQYDEWVNTVIFKEGRQPATGKELRARYIKDLERTNDNGAYDYGDIKSNIGFEHDSIKSVMNAVYSNIFMVRPSVPTTLSFTSLSSLNNGWQRDSGLFYWGNINTDRISLFHKPDVSADPLNCDFAPMYFGKLRTYKGNPKRNTVMVAGTREQDIFIRPQGASDFKVGIYNLDYGKETGAGNKNVTLQQSIGGAYYQKHYFSYHTHDEEADSPEGKYSPSMYSGKYHISPFSVLHPNDGVVGMLTDMFAVHPKNIAQADDLEVEFKNSPYTEEFGRGDDNRKIYHLTHSPSKKDSGDFVHFKVRVGCEEKILGNDFTYEPETKAIVFNEAPNRDEALVAEYKFIEKYRFTLPDTETSPYNDPKCSPYTKIGVAILKENINFLG